MLPGILVIRRRELIHQRDKLTKLQAALEVEERRASELIVAAGGPAPAHMVVLSPNMNAHTEKSATRKVQAEHYDCNSEVERDRKQEEDGTDIDDDDDGNASALATIASSPTLRPLPLFN